MFVMRTFVRASFDDAAAMTPPKPNAALAGRRSHFGAALDAAPPETSCAVSTLRRESKEAVARTAVILGDHCTSYIQLSCFGSSPRRSPVRGFQHTVLPSQPHEIKRDGSSAHQLKPVMPWVCPRSSLIGAMAFFRSHS